VKLSKPDVDLLTIYDLGFKIPKTNVMVQLSHKFVLILKRHFFRRNYFKIITSVPGLQLLAGTSTARSGNRPSAQAQV
jgi:hypothetical protein